MTIRRSALRLATKWWLAAGLAIIAIGLTAVFLPVTKLKARCCFGDQCEWVEGEMAYLFALHVAALPVPRYVDSGNTPYVSYWTRWTRTPPEILQKHTGDIARSFFKNTPPASRPEWWPTKMREKHDCCFVYPIALTEASWREVSQRKPRCGRDGQRAR